MGQWVGFPEKGHVAGLWFSPWLGHVGETPIGAWETYFDQTNKIASFTYCKEIYDFQTNVLIIGVYIRAE